MIPFNNLLGAVRDLASIYPDRQTPAVYWDYIMDCPGDIIGTALYQLDVGIPLEHNDRDVSSLHWRQLGFAGVFGPALRWLQFVQDFGDKGYVWGRCVAAADELFPFIPEAVA